MSNRGGRGKVRGHRVKCGFVQRQERGLAAVAVGCNEFFAKRGMKFDLRGDFLFGSKDRSHRAQLREEARLDRIAEQLGQVDEI